MGVRDWGLGIDVIGNWGSELFRKLNDNTRALGGLSLADGAFPVTSFSGSVVGMGDIAGPYTTTVEFTAQYAASGGHGADWLIQQMLLLEDPNDPGAFRGASDDFDGGPGWNRHFSVCLGLPRLRGWNSSGDQMRTRASGLESPTICS